MSLLQNQPNKYNYVFNEYNDEDLFFLSVDSMVFIDLCYKYALTQRTLTKRAVSKEINFMFFKKIYTMQLLNTVNSPFIFDHANRKNNFEFELIDHLIEQFHVATEYR